MQQSDKFLFASLKQEGFDIEERVQSVADITNDDLLSICIQLLDMFNVDTVQIKQRGKTQKFWVATRINQELTKHVGAQFQLNDLMNTNVNNVRKILMLLMSKLSMLDGDSKGFYHNYLSKEYKFKKETLLRKQKIWKNWLSRKWVHPSLTKQKDVKFESHKLRYDLNERIEEKNILKDFEHPRMKCNIQVILSEIYSLYAYTKKKISAEEGIRVNIQDIAQANLDTIRENNQNDWMTYKENTKKINTMKKKLIESKTDQTLKEKAQSLSLSKEETVFQQQVSELLSLDKIKEQKDKTDEDITILQSAKITEQHQAIDSFNKIRQDIQKVRNNHKKDINSMICAIQSSEARLKKLELQQANTEQDIVKKQQQIQKLKTNFVTTKNQAEKKQILLNSLQEPNKLSKEILTLVEQIKLIQIEAKSEIDKMQDQIDSLQQQRSKKLQILIDMKEKLVKIQQDYAEVVRYIVYKNQQKQFIKIPQVDISRNYYNKRITEMEIRWKDGRRQIEKANQEIDRFNTSIGTSISLSSRIETEIENRLNMDKNKNDTLNKLMKEQYQKCKRTFWETVKIIKSVAEIYTQSRQYEGKSAQLSVKNYKVSIQKIKFGLRDARKERSRLYKKN